MFDDWIYSCARKTDSDTNLNLSPGVYKKGYFDIGVSQDVQRLMFRLTASSETFFLWSLMEPEGETSGVVYQFWQAQFYWNVSQDT